MCLKNVCPLSSFGTGLFQSVSEELYKSPASIISNDIKILHVYNKKCS